MPDGGNYWQKADRNTIMKRSDFILISVLITVIFTVSAAAEIHGPEVYTNAIKTFKEADKANPPAPGGILFLGSSSIGGWDLEKFFPGLDVLNRGYGGSYISDSIFYADQVLLPYKPRAVVFYAGDNDLAAGKSPDQVFSDYKELASIFEENLPDTDFIFVAIKPSIARIHMVESLRQVNRSIQEYCGGNPRFMFLDIDAPMLGEDGQPNPDLFKDDGLHMNESGYTIWSDMVRPMLKK
jgi:lysophospholipase L1-like esterase